LFSLGEHAATTATQYDQQGELTMRSRASTLIWLSLVAAGLGACDKTTGVQATEPKRVERVAEGRIEGPYVAAGTQFVAVLQQELGTARSSSGTSFTARVRNNLTTPDGQTLVPAGSELKGRVVSVDSGPEPSMKLDFETIGTTGGNVPIAATLTRAHEYVWLDPEFIYDPFAGYEAVLFHPVYRPGYVTPTPSGPGVRPDVVYSREITLPEGAELTLTLTRPLLGASSRVSPS
jgi:hypothetical protein